MDGGVSLLLVGDGKGGFEPLWPNRSGIVVPGDARKVQVVDLNGDAKPDLVFAVQNGTWRAFRNAQPNPCKRQQNRVACFRARARKHVRLLHHMPTP